jgi:N-acetylmuramoyl-L-alanine amidase
MTFICLQAGHYPRTTGATGAPGEQELNWRITNRLSDILISKGFVVQIVGADPTDAEIKKDFDLFLALHGDADVYGTGGGVIGYIDPAIDLSEESNKESKRLKEAIESVYFKESGIVNHPERLNKNITQYYMWRRLTANTHCVLLEMGVVQDAHDKVILADTDMVSKAIAKGICFAYGVNYESTPEPIPPTPPTPETCDDVKKELEDTKKALSDAQKQNSDALALKDAECNEKIESYKTRLADELDKTIKNTI